MIAGFCLLVLAWMVGVGSESCIAMPWLLAQTQTRNNSNGFIRPSFALANPQCDWMEVEIIQ